MTLTYTTLGAIIGAAFGLGVICGLTGCALWAWSAISDEPE